MALDPSDVAIWRVTGRMYMDVYVYVSRPKLKFAARVNQASTDYPTDKLVFDNVTVGAYSDIRNGMTVLLGSTALGDDRGRNRVRRRPNGEVSTSSEVYVGRYSQGLRDGELSVIDNDYITVNDQRMVWAVPPYITDEGVTYKDSEVGFADDIAQPPVVIMGAHRMKIVDGALSTATFDFDGSDSYTTHPDADGSLDYYWDFGDGTFSTSATEVAHEYSPGEYWVMLRIEDNLGNASYGYRMIAVLEKDSPQLLNGFTIQQHTQARDGQTMRIQLNQPLPVEDSPDGGMVLVTVREVYGFNGEHSFYDIGDSGQTLFAGWIQDEANEGSADGGNYRARTTLNLVDVAGRLKSLPAFPQLVERDDTPTRWERMEKANIDRYVLFLLRWHSNALELADFFWSGTGETYAFPTLGSDGGTLYEQADIRTQAIAHKLTCDQFGRLAMKPDPIIMPTVAQAAAQSLPYSRTTEEILELNASDWQAWRYSYARPPRVHWNWGEAIVASTLDVDDVTDIATVFCVAPGKAPGQGATSQTSGQQLAINQIELNIREGHRYVRMNPRFSTVELDMVRVGNVGIDPARMIWVTLANSAQTADLRGRYFDGERFLPLEVRWEYGYANGVYLGYRLPTLVLEREVAGTPAETYVPPDESASGLPELPPYNPPINPNPDPYLGTGKVVAFLGGTNTRYVRTTNFNTPSTAGGATWEIVSMGLSGRVMDAIPDPFSPAYITGSGAVNAWVVTNEEIHYVEDLFGTPTITSVHTFASAGNSLLNRSIQTERGTQNWVIVTSYYAGTGMTATYSTTARTPASFTETGVIGGHVTNGAIGQAANIWMSPHTAGTARLVTNRSVVGSGDYGSQGFFETTDFGATWNDLGFNIVANGRSPQWIEQSFTDTTTFYVSLGTGSGTGTTSFRIYKVVGTTVTEVSPEYSGNKYGATYRSLRVSDSSHLRLIMVGDRDNATQTLGIAVSLDGATTWNWVITPNVANDGVYSTVRLNGIEAAYVFGNGRIFYAPPTLNTLNASVLDERSGNLSTLGVTEAIINIAGGVG